MIFDSYQRTLKVEKLDSKKIGFGAVATSLSVTTENNIMTLSDEGITFQRARQTELNFRRVPQDVSNPVSTIGLILRKPVPLPFMVINTPNPEMEDDGSYEYTPDVVGGLEPYSFHLDGDVNGGFEFNTKTGTLSRPPQ